MYKQKKLNEILGLEKTLLDRLDKKMKASTGSRGVLAKVEGAIDAQICDRLGRLGLSFEAPADVLSGTLFAQIDKNERELYQHIGISAENFNFNKIAQAARDIATAKEGFFLKPEFAEKILRQRPPTTILKQLGYKNIDEMLKKEDVREIFSALRFMETDEWMHETFQHSYTGFTAADFEYRPIEIRVLGDQWARVSQKFVAKKHHNVSHLKEFGIIFLNPIAQTEQGKFMRDFALLLHYLHEVHYYSKLFENAAHAPEFSKHFIELLRGDVPNVKTKSRAGTWLVVQRYLWKENPDDARLLMPRINPEALHWRKAELDLIEYVKRNSGRDLEFWRDLDWVAGFFATKYNHEEFISFDLEDNAMSFVAANQNIHTNFFYHQREALWNKIFAEYAGGYDKLEEYAVGNMREQKINF